MTGPAFEARLGELLRWREMVPLALDFVRLGHANFQPSGGGYLGGLERTAKRLDSVRNAVNRTLYDLFDQKHVDEKKAEITYRRLLKALGNPSKLVVATTNYDRSIEAGLRRLKIDVVTGFDHSAETVPPLDPSLLSEVDRPGVPVLPLHGAVGWYRRDGQVFDHRGGQDFNPSLGTPVVLYPDPDKDPTDDAAVSGLWEQFESAASNAEAVCVIGHSLHDDGLVDVLRREADSGKPVVIGYCEKETLSRVEEEV